jgi:hypothetical protein
LRAHRSQTNSSSSPTFSAGPRHSAFALSLAGTRLRAGGTLRLRSPRWPSSLCSPSWQPAFRTR